MLLRNWDQTLMAKISRVRASKIILHEYWRKKIELAPMVSLSQGARGILVIRRA